MISHRKRTKTSRKNCWLSKGKNLRVCVRHIWRFSLESDCRRKTQMCQRFKFTAQVAIGQETVVAFVLQRRTCLLCNDVGCLL